MLPTGVPGLVLSGLHKLPGGGFVSAYNYFGGPSQPELWFVRHSPTGAPDTNQGLNGAVKVPGTERLFCLATAIQPDGKLIYVGRSFITLDTRNDFFIARVGTDGQLDASFAGDGLIIQDLSPQGGVTDDEIFAAEVLPDGRLLFAGSKVLRIDQNTHHLSIFLTRLNADGSLDRSFGDDGFAMFPIGTARMAEANALLSSQNDGSILAGFKTTLFGETADIRSHRIFKLTPDGSLDASFSDDGVVEVNSQDIYNFAHLSTLPNGKILSSTGQGQLTRLNPDGSFDRSFGVNGKMNILNVIAYEMIVLPNGKLLAAGYTPESVFPNKTIGAVARYHADGTPDIRFGRGGVLRLEHPERGVELVRMKPLPDNTLLLAGIHRISGPTLQPFVSRLFPGK